MFTPSSSDTLLSQVVKVPRSDRWQIYQRLQELMVPCCCPADGSLRVEVNNGIHAILVHSTVKQFVASRHELVDWLERCWDTQEV